MRFDEIQGLIPQYLAGELMPAERASFEQELAKNADLRIELEELSTLWQGLGLIDEEHPSAAMRARFYQKLNAVTKEQSGKVPRRGWRDWKFSIPQLAAAAALFVLGVFAGRMNFAGSASGSEVAQLRGQLEGLRQTVALSLLDQDSASSRLEGVSWSNSVKRPDGELVTALVTTLNHDQNINVRLASLDALEKLASDATVRKALEKSIPLQTSPLVQIALIDALVHMRDSGAAGELRKLTSDQDLNSSVRQRAQWGLQKLNYE